MERIAISVLSQTLSASSATNPRGISVVARTDCMALIPPVKPTPAGASTSSKVSQSQNCTPKHSWKTFLRSHADEIVSIDLFVVPTISFRLLYGLLILQHGHAKSCGWE